METNASLETLIQQKDHLNVLRYIRFHQLRRPELALQHGQEILKQQSSLNASTRLSVLEQTCLAAADLDNHDLAQSCLDKLRQSGVSPQSVRFRLVLARCMEANNQADSAKQIYDAILTDNPACQLAMKRKYCLLKATDDNKAAALEALQTYVQDNRADATAWYELATVLQERGDFVSAAYALEQILLATPMDADIHVKVAECYATAGTHKYLLRARQHMAQALELNPSHRRAQFGLVTVANACLLLSLESDNNNNNNKGKQDGDDHDCAVARELVKFGAEKLVASYKGSSMFPAVQALMKEYKEDN